MWRIDINSKYMIRLLINDLACNGLRVTAVVPRSPQSQWNILKYFAKTDNRYSCYSRSITKNNRYFMISTCVSESDDYLLSLKAKWPHFSDDIFWCISLNERVLYFHLNLIEVCFRSSVLFRYRRGTGYTPLPEPVLAQFADAYMRY